MEPVMPYPSSTAATTQVPPPDRLVQLVRDALRHLHDPFALQTHPLAQLLVEAKTETGSRGKVLQRVLLEAVAALQPSGDSPDVKAARRFDLLTSRYVEGLDIDAILDKLAISRRQYTREHRQALDAVTSFLCDSRPRAVPSLPVSLTQSLLAAKHVSLPLTSFIGREDLLAEILDIVSNVRLLTLTGAPGSGKTRLALHAAHALQQQDDTRNGVFRDGILFVPLADLAAPDMVIRAIAQRMGLMEHPNVSLLESVETMIAERSMLLVLDNFEHVLDATPVLSRLLTACPRLHMLVTSRASLRLAGEHERFIPPLDALQSGATGSIEEISRSEAVRLYVDRAQAAHRHFRLTEQNAPDILALCQMLDGLPLAIELAAARCRLFSPRALLRRITHELPQNDPLHRQRSALHVLGSGGRDAAARQQTLYHAIEWSFRLLSPHEQQIFAQLSCFVGGWTYEAAEVVCECAGAPLMDGISSLIEKSLIVVQDVMDDEPRLSMLRIIHEFAREQLAKFPELGERVQRRHALYYLRLAQQFETAHWGADQATWLRRLYDEVDNLRGALAWARDSGNVELALHLGGALQMFWFESGGRAEGCAWLESLLQRASPAHRTSGRATALTGAALCNWGLGNLLLSQQQNEESLSICQELRDLRGMCRALQGLAVVASEQGDFSAARRLTEQTLSAAREADDMPYIALALHGLAIYAIRERDEATALSRIEESRRIWQKLGSTRYLSLTSNNLGNLARIQGQYAEAAYHYQESLALIGEDGPAGWRGLYLQNLGHAFRHLEKISQSRDCFLHALRLFHQVGDRRGMAECVAGFAGLLAQSHLHQAIQLFGAADACMTASGMQRNPFHQQDVDQLRALAHLQLDTETFVTLFTRGTNIPIEQVVTDILDEHLPYRR